MHSDNVSGAARVGDRKNPAQIICDQFVREFRSFVDELIGGTNKYRQLYSLSEQIPHDYHDRFLVELIQNANDASDPGGEVRIVLVEGDEDTEPRIYVANRGLAFTERNFAAICGLGVSDKDPEKAIGNKGLGFRSVLQVCDEPRVWSDHPDPSKRRESRLGGFCFEFTPLVREDIIAILTDGIAPESKGLWTHPILQRMGFHGKLIEEATRFTRLRDRVLGDEFSISEEVRYLSPYAFPLAADQDEVPPVVSELIKSGFVTAIELALHAGADLEAAKRAVKEIRAEYLLFSTNLSAIVVEHRNAPDPDLSRRFEKRSVPRESALTPPPRLSGVEIVSNLHPAASNQEDTPPAASVQIDDSGHRARTWWVHHDEVSGQKLREAVLKLPQRWHDVRSATVTVAIECATHEPPEGRFTIFLPTHQKTGSPVWINAPFHGNLARTEIALGEPYNQLLFERAVSLTIEMIQALQGSLNAPAIPALIDLLDHRAPSSVFVGALDRKLADTGAPLQRIPAVAIHSTVDGEPVSLASVSDVRLPFQGLSLDVLVPDRLARAGALVPAPQLTATRLDALNRIAGRAKADLNPQSSELAGWIEGVAAQLQLESALPAMWNAFYEEVAQLARPPAVRDALRSRKFLWTEDGHVLSTADHRKLFAYPGLGSTLEDDPDEVDITEGSGDPRANIPPAIRPYVTFLSREVRLLSDGQPRRFNPVGNLLREGSPPFVPKFDTRSIVNSVLIPIVKSAAPHASSRARDEFLSQTLAWSFELYHSARARSRFDQVQWSALHVPTREGWTPADRAYFGEEWINTPGALLKTAFSADHPAQQRMLVSPREFARRVGRRSEFQTEEYRAWIEFLRDYLGVGTGPHLRVSAYTGLTESARAHLKMEGCRNTYEANKLTNFFGFPGHVWEAFTKGLETELRAPVKHREAYYLEDQTHLEGLSEIISDTAAAYAKLVFKSSSRIRKSLKTSVRRPYGGRSDATAPSTLLVALRQMEWLPYKYDESSTHLDGLCRPSDVWYVPADRLQSPLNRARYSFVRHLPGDVAAVIDSSSDELRRQVGLRSIDVDSWEDGVELLAHLSEYARCTSTIERVREFGEMWRETLVVTARHWRDAGADGARLRDAAATAGWDGAWALRASRAGWHPLTGSDKGEEVFLPDNRVLRASLADWLPIVDVREDLLEAQLTLLENAFGPRVVRLSGLDLVPQHSGGDLETSVDRAPLVGAVVPWLIPFTLTVFAFGRANRDVSLGSPRFQDLISRFKQVEYLSVENLSLEVTGIARPIPTLTPSSHYWQRVEKNDVLLVDDRALDNATSLVHALQSFFGVSDIEHPLYRALDQLAIGLDGTHPSDEAQRAALMQLHIAREEIDRVRSAILGGDEDWTLDRALLIVAAIMGVADTIDAAKIRELFPSVSGEPASAVLGQINPQQLAPFTASQIEQLARSDGTDADLAERLWRDAGVTLQRWNAASSALGIGHRVRNEAIESDFSHQRKRLRSIFLCVVREALRRKEDYARYIETKRQYDDLKAPAPWEYEHWALPLDAIREFLLHSITPHIGSLSQDLREVLAADVTSIDGLVQRAIDFGLRPDHDDEATERRNRDLIEKLRDGVLSFILESWSESAAGGAEPPTAFFGAMSEEDVFVEAVRSECQVQDLQLDGAKRIILERLRTMGIFQELGVPALEVVDSLDWSAFLQHAQADGPSKKLEHLRTLAAKVAQTQVVLGRRFLQEGDNLVGLGQLIDEAISPEFGRGLDLASRSAMVQVAQTTKKPNSRSKGRRGRISARERELVGAVGEYLFYKVLCGHPELGPDAARDAWKSKNREHFFLDQGKDDVGYDFEYTLAGVRYLVEVKAGGGGDFVDLSENEVGEAKRHARKSKSRTKYVVAVVQNPMSDPQVRLLGNPFDRDGSTMMRVRETGARVFFSLR
jgi:hypothetical protein